MAVRKRKAVKRSTIAIGLVAFLVITFVVVWRRSVGVANGRQIARMETRRRELETEIKSLQRDIRDASSNRVVVSEAERSLGMHVATDAQVRTVTRSARDNELSDRTSK